MQHSKFVYRKLEIIQEEQDFFHTESCCLQQNPLQPQVGFDDVLPDMTDYDTSSKLKILKHEESENQKYASPNQGQGLWQSQILFGTGPVSSNRSPRLIKQDRQDQKQKLSINQQENPNEFTQDTSGSVNFNSNQGTSGSVNFNTSTDIKKIVLAPDQKIFKITKVTLKTSFAIESSDEVVLTTQVNNDIVDNESSSEIGSLQIKNMYAQGRKYSFFLERTCFRKCAEYYCERYRIFNQTLEKQYKLKYLEVVEKDPKKIIDTQMRMFIEFEFQGLKLSSFNMQKLINYLIIYIFNYRLASLFNTKKSTMPKDRFIRDTLEQMKEYQKPRREQNYAVLWKLKNRYSKNLMRQFFEDQLDCFLFTHFASSTEGQAFLENKSTQLRQNVKDALNEDKQGDYTSQKLGLLLNELEILNKKAKANCDWQI